MTRLSFCFHRVLCVAVALLCFAGIAAPAWAQFETRATHVLPNESFAVVTGDFNGDGKLDIAVLDSNGLTILLGNGDGTFGAPVTYATGLAYSMALADFNCDGKLDIAVANLSPSTVDVFLGNGDGTFQLPIPSSTTAGSYFVAVGDFNNDKIPDLAIIDPPYVSVLLGNGGGTFQAPSDNNSFVGPHQLAVGDFNNDHKLDVAVVGYFGGSQDLGILLGNGDGTLQSSLTYPLANTPGSVAAADFNHDGNLDVAIGAYFGNGVAVLLGNGDASFKPAQTYLGGGGPVIVGDLKRDGKLDLIAGLSLPGVSEFLGTGDGTFQPAKGYRAPSGGLAASGDLNGDLLPDVILLDGHHATITTMLNTGWLSFSPSAPLQFPVQTVGSSGSPLSVTLTNTGAKAVSISSVVVSGQFQLGSGTTCAASVAAGASCAISIVFQPLTAGRQGGLVTLVDGASSKPQVVGLSGRGTDLEVSPTSLTFGSQAVGTKSKPQEVTVTNVSGTAVGFSKVGIGGRDSQDFSQTNTCGSQLAGNASCTIEVTFAPTQKGARSGDLYFTVTLKDGSPASVILSGTGT